MRHLILITVLALAGCQTLQNDVSAVRADLAKAQAAGSNVISKLVQNCQAATSVTNAVASTLANDANTAGTSTASDAAGVAQGTATVCAVATALKAGQ